MSERDPKFTGKEIDPLKGFDCTSLTDDFRENAKSILQLSDLSLSSDRVKIVNKFGIIAPQSGDFEGTEKWKEFRKKGELKKTWRTSSYFSKFQKLKLIEDSDDVITDIVPRCSQAEEKSMRELVNLYPQIDENTAVILDSGGSHSVAMSCQLLADKRMEPILMFDTKPSPQGTNRQAMQELATMLYFSGKVAEEKRREEKRRNPIFVLDCHRDDFIWQDETGVVNNNYSFSVEDFPTAEELKSQGITKIVYLSEGDQFGQINKDFQSTDRLLKDLKPMVKEWQQAGIEIKYTGISPT